MQRNARLTIALFAVTFVLIAPLCVVSASTAGSSTVSSSTSTIASLQSLVATLEAQLKALIAQKSAAPAPVATPNATFSRTLMLGSTGPDVSALQTILKTAGFYTYPTITGYFGAATEVALQKFQAAHHIVSSGTAATTGYGALGPKTRAVLDSLSPAGGSAASGPSSRTPSTSAAAPSSGASAFPVYAGYGGGGGGGTNPAPTPDTTPPVVAIATPGNGTILSGSTVSLSTSATDNVAVASVQFEIDGTNIGGAINAAPYAMTWDSSSVADGAHTITALATDTSGNQSVSSIVVTVDNTPPVISGISGSATGETTASIGWTTDKPATTQINYGTTSSYGSTSVLDPALVTSHSVSLTGLSPSVTYHYETITADSQGNTATSSDQTFTTPDLTPPTVSVTAPSGGSTQSGVTVTLSASASDNVGVAGVQFEVDGSSVGSLQTTAPYAVSWNSSAVSDGSHTIIAVAHDAAGNYATSSTITITTDNTAPTRSGGAPTGTLSYGTTSTTLSLTTSENATCHYSTISGTAYASGIAFNTTGGTSQSTTITGLSSNTSYIYYVRCQDAYGNTNKSDFAISFSIADASSPSVSLTAPLSGNTVSGPSVSLTATASDTIAVSNVQFKIDGSNIGSAVTVAPYATTWNSTGVADGAHTLYAVALNTSGKYATSSISVTVDNTPPILSAISSGTPTQTSATITWNTNEPATSQINYGPNSSYGASTTIDSTLVSSHSVTITGLTHDQTYHFRVRSTDGQGNLSVSTDQTLTAGDGTPPSVGVSAPLGGTIISGASVTLSATSSDNVGVTGVQFKIDGSNIGSTGTGSPYSITWNSASVADGTHSIVAVAHDAAFNYATSSAISITVDNTPPTVSITAPTSSAMLSGSTVTFTASSTDNIGVAGIQFAVDGTNVGSMGTTSPYSIVWDSTSITDGAHTISAIARDAVGNYATTSESVTVSNTLTATTTPNQSVNEVTYASFPTTVTGGTAPYTYLWDFGDLATTSVTTYTNTPSPNYTNSTQDFTSSAQNAYHQYNYQGAFNAVVKVTDALGHVAYATSSVTVRSVLPIASAGAGYRGWPISGVPATTTLPGIDYTVGSRIPLSSLTEIDPTNAASKTYPSGVAYDSNNQKLNISGSVVFSGYLVKDISINDTAASSTISDDIFEYTPAYYGFIAVRTNAGVSTTTITHIEIDAGRNNNDMTSALNVQSPTNVTYSYFHGSSADTIDFYAPGEFAYNYVSDLAWSSASHGDAIQENAIYTNVGTIVSGCGPSAVGGTCIHDNVVDPANLLLQGVGGNNWSGYSNDAFRINGAASPSVINANTYSNVFLPGGTYTTAIGTDDYPVSGATFQNNYIYSFSSTSTAFVASGHAPGNYFGYIYPDATGSIFPNDTLFSNNRDSNTGATLSIGVSLNTLAMTIALDNSSIYYTSTSSPHTATFTLESTGYNFQNNDSATVTIATTSTTCLDSNLASPLSTQIASALTGVSGLSYNSATGVVTLSKGFSGSVAIPITAGASDSGSNCNIALALTNPSAGTVSQYLLQSVAVDPSNTGTGYHVGDYVNSTYTTVQVTGISGSSISSVGSPLFVPHVVSPPANPIAQYIAGIPNSNNLSGTNAKFNYTWITPGTKTTTLVSTTVSYDAASTAIFNSWTGNSCSVSLTEKGYVDTWVKAAKADGTFSKLGGAFFLQSLGGCSNKDAYTNWISPASLAVASGTVTCTSKYCKGTSSTGYLDSGITEASIGASQNNMALGVYQTGTLGTGTQVGAGNAPGTSVITNVNGNISTRINASAGANFSTTTGLSTDPNVGGIGFSRNASSTVIFATEKDGSTSTTSLSSTGVPPGDLYILAGYTTAGALNYGNGRQVAFAFFATSTASADLAHILTDAYNYLVSIGAQ